eukprot:TRINITY_DN3606_c0_g1_i1.p2 TRINITY_DN3606_c0_g1~~TRINITY_DN3606_c0_g1_i1.p2  ORF type:complete len:280 (+),score=63.28 TRINITY_DN3606_c0_g1_i1:70-909(+)
MQNTNASESQLDNPVSKIPDDQEIDVFTTLKCPIKLDPSPSPSSLLREDLKGVPGAYLIRNVLSASECQQLIEFSESLGYSEAKVSTYGGQVTMKDVRDNKRLVYVAPQELWNTIYERVWHLFPQMEDRREDAYKLSGLNERFRFYCYEPGQRFQPHFDGAYGSKEHHSLYTIIIYLNEGFEGGHTTFYDLENIKKRIKVNPRMGTALVFPHGNHPLSPYHEGSACSNGVKYALRSDVMYERTGESSSGEIHGRRRGPPPPQGLGSWLMSWFGGNTTYQ